MHFSVVEFQMSMFEQYHLLLYFSAVASYRAELIMIRPNSVTVQPSE